MPTVDRLTPIMQALLDCVNGNLTYPVNIKTIAPGASVAWDDCCNGELWVRVMSLAAAGNPSMQPCSSHYLVQVGVGVIRCAAVVNDQGVSPSGAQMSADAAQTFKDFADIMQAINCCFAPLTESLGVGTLRIGNWSPLGPQGGCVGGEVTMSFNYDACQPCEE